MAKGIKGTCPLCIAKNRAEIEDSIRSRRRSQSDVARAMRVDPAVVSRHQSGHGSAPPPPAALRMSAPPPALEGTPTGRALAELAEIHDGALKRYRTALKDGSLRDIAQLVTALRRNLDRRRELEEMSAPPDPDAYEPQRDAVLAVVRDRLAEALRPYPEATAAVLEALRR